jgi:hypothetical protein
MFIGADKDDRHHGRLRLDRHVKRAAHKIL